MKRSVPQNDPPRRLAGLRLVSLWTLLSRILGFTRDAAMAGVFGLGPVLDAFTLAFRIPNLARSLFGEGALATAFLPAFVHERQTRGDDAARRLATAVLLRLAIILAALVAIAEAGLWAFRTSGNLSPYSLRLVDLLAIMTPYLLLICLAALCSAMLQALGRFGWPAAIPAALNVWWLSAVVGVAIVVVDPERRIRLVAMALLIGGAMQFLLPATILWRSGWGPARDFSRASVPARAVFSAMVPTIFATTISQFNTVLDTFLAWLLASPDAAAFSGRGVWIEPGTAAALYFAQRLYQFPMGLIGIAAGTVLFPTLAAHASSKNFAALRDDLTHGMCVAMSVAIPASGGLVVLAAPITAALFQHGRFGADDALITSRITAIYGSAAWAAIALLLIQRGFFAVGDRITPLKTGLVSVAVNIVLTLVGVWYGGGTGLATATALTAVFHLTLSLILLRRHVVSLDAAVLRPCILKSAAATGVMMVACLATRLACADHWGRLLTLFLPMAAGVGTFFAAAKLLGLQEPWELLAVRRKSRPPLINPESGPTPHVPMEPENE